MWSEPAQLVMWQTPSHFETIDPGHWWGAMKRSWFRFSCNINACRQNKFLVYKTQTAASVDSFTRFAMQQAYSCQNVHLQNKYVSCTLAVVTFP